MIFLDTTDNNHMGYGHPESTVTHLGVPSLAEVKAFQDVAKIGQAFARGHCIKTLRASMKKLDSPLIVGKLEDILSGIHSGLKECCVFSYYLGHNGVVSRRLIPVPDHVSYVPCPDCLVANEFTDILMNGCLHFDDGVWNVKVYEENMLITK